MVPLCNNPKTNYDCSNGEVAEGKDEADKSFIFDTKSLDFGKIVAEFEAPTDGEECDGGCENIKKSENTAGIETGVDFHDVDGGDEIERKSKN